MPTFGGNRTVSVELKAKVDGYLASFRSAAAQTKAFAGAAAKASQDHKRAWSEVSSGALAAGGAIGIGVGLAVKSFADFDQAMSRAAAGTNATGKELDTLRAAAIKAGADTQFSATEAADAITALGKAGVSTNDILAGGLQGSLSLAAAGELEVKDAAEIAATALTQFGLAGKDLPHVADLLAAGAGKAQGEVSDLANALKYVGPVAKGMGISIEETVGTLAEFASQGIISEQAGTGLRGVLSSLTAPSKLAAKEMAALGINVYDAQGNFIGLAGVAGQLKGALGGMTAAQRDAALGTIFGNEQLTAARVLYSGGAESVQKWTKAVDDQGFASDQAAKLTDNLSGDIERLSGSLSSAFITSGSGANSVLRDMVKTANEAVNVFNELPAPVQQSALAIAAIGAASLLVVGGAAKAVGAVSSLKTNLAELGVSGGRVKAGLSGVSGVLGGPWGLAITAATVGLGLFAAQQAEASAEARELRDSLNEQTGAVTDATKSLVAHKLQTSGLLDQAKSLGLSLQDVTDAALGDADALARLDTAGAANAASLSGVADQAKSASTAVGAFGTATQFNSGVLAGAVTQADLAKSSYTGLRAVIAQQSGDIAKQAVAVKQEAEARGESTTAADKATGAASGLASATKQTTEANKAAKEAQDELSESLNVSKNTFLGLRDAERGYEAALDDTAGALKKNGKSLDIHTEKGRANADALDQLAKSAIGYLAGLDSNGASAGQFNKVLDQTYNSLVKAAKGFGLSDKAARAYAEQALDVPYKVETKIEQPGMKDAQANTSSYDSALRALQPKSVTAFQQPGMAAGISGAADLSSGLSKIPSQVSTRVDVSGLLDAIANTGRLAKDLKSIDGKVVETRIVTKTVTTGGGAKYSSVGARATGGPVPGWMGTPGQDSVHALVMPREFIQPVASVDYYGPAFMEAVRTRSLPKMADGGFVGRVMTSAPAYATASTRDGDTYVVNASTVEARALIREQQHQADRLAAIRGRG